MGVSMGLEVWPSRSSWSPSLAHGPRELHARPRDPWRASCRGRGAGAWGCSSDADADGAAARGRGASSTCIRSGGDRRGGARVRVGNSERPRPFRVGRLERLERLERNATLLRVIRVT